jgi:hypothetical protein
MEGRAKNFAIVANPKSQHPTRDLPNAKREYNAEIELHLRGIQFIYVFFSYPWPLTYFH